MPTGISLSGLGGALLIAGGATVGTSDCNASGCASSADRQQYNGGAMLLGAGAGFALAGGLSILGGLVAAPGRDKAHLRAGNMVAGIVFLGLAAAGGSLTLAYTFDPHLEGDPAGTGVLLSLAPGLATTIGLPLLVSGAPLHTPGEPPREARPRRSRSMANAGYALMALGGAMLKVAPFPLWFDDSEDPGNRFAGFLILTTVGSATVLTAIPVLAVGLSRKDAPMPSIGAGPGGAALSWSFD